MSRQMTPVVVNVYRFERDLQPVSLLHVVPGHNVGTCISRPAFCRSNLVPTYLLVVANGRMDKECDSSTWS